MNRLEDDRYAGHQALFSISSLETSFPSRLIKCKSEEVQHAATITKPPKRSRPGRRRLSMHRVPISLTTILLSIVMALSVLCKPTEAAHNPGSQSRAVKGHFVDGRIMFDRNLAPLPGLRRRDDQASTDTASATTTPEVAASSSSSDATTTKTLPTAFDGGFGTNYTQPSCPTFLRSMINNATFASCVPFSLLLQNSMSFFGATRSLSTITAVLNVSCSVSFPACSSLMSSFALTLRSSSACQADYNSQNPQVRQAYAGLLAYDVSYNASCLKNSPATPGSESSGAQQDNNNNYCFANAITNRSSPTDSYIYYLPLGITLPSGSLPTCNSCLENTMALYATVASNKTQPLNLDYVQSATLINEMCGPNFVNASIPSARSSSSGGGRESSAASLRTAEGLLGKGWLWGALLAAATGLVAAL